MSDLFNPTWLYVKVHNKTGLKYLGKTIQNPYFYDGSGKHWKSHLKKHGKDITTLWVHKYDDQSLLKEEALFFSKIYDVVNSKEWANKIVEDGSTGGNTYIRTPELNAIMSSATTGNTMPVGFGEKISKAKTGKKRPAGFGDLMSSLLTGIKKPAGFSEKISCALSNKAKTDSHKLNLSESIKNIPKLKCSHCGTTSSPGNHKRWHNENCKSKIIK